MKMLIWKETLVHTLCAYPLIKLYLQSHQWNQSAHILMKICRMWWMPRQVVTLEDISMYVTVF